MGYVLLPSCLILPRQDGARRPRHPSGMARLSGETLVCEM